MEHYQWPNTYKAGKIIVIDTSLHIQSKIFDDVLIVQEYTGPTPGALKCGKTFYAKNIGIIRKEYTAITTDSITSFEDLIDYKVNK